MKCISQYVEDAKHAGPKAKKDIESILKKHYSAKNYVIHDFDNKTLKNILRKRLDQIIFLLMFSNTKELTVVQYPFSNIKVFTKNLKNKILLIHDINGLRNMNKPKLQEEISCFNCFDYIIVHNNIMKNFLISCGVNANLYTLECFDYLCSHKNIKKDNDSKFPTVVYAGNLQKSPFIYELVEEKMNFKLLLYGIGYNGCTNKKIEYKGAFTPEELPEILEGDIGLIWDGHLNESDSEEPLKNYTKFNNPHKLSCYIASGIPVIVWENAAVANLVKKYDIGYCINCLNEINDLNFSNYKIKLHNAQKMSELLRSGYYTKRVMEKILIDLDKNEIKYK